MSAFSKGERVRIVESDKQSEKVYRIKDVRPFRKGNGTIYLLKSLEENSVLCLYYENEISLLERIY
jgi:hypothetical protein